MIKRRTVLLGSVAAAGIIAALRFESSSDVDSIVAILHKRLSFLQLDEAGVRRFAADLASLHVISSTRLRTVSALGPLYSRTDFLPRSYLGAGIRHGEERVVTSYLLSSDFFINGSDASEVIHYLGFYDPLRACGNPFARRVVST